VISAPPLRWQEGSRLATATNRAPEQAVDAPLLALAQLDGPPFATRSTRSVASSRALDEVRYGAP
jgi:hypothetical protein